mmetsp:Transcript_14141/g.21218  ORF Transcript_14141/g.21218 Transcript_14141/m.21218 type:complete len:299 (-) Transcript_14141:122-1018(-)
MNELENVIDANAFAAVGDGSLPMRKRKDVSGTPNEEPQKKQPKLESDSEILAAALAAAAPPSSEADLDLDLDPMGSSPMPKAREVRLEQNRKAARESRRRKKIMIEELQRSVVFFSRANGTLKQQNDELQRMLIQSQARVSAFENGDSSGLPSMSNQDSLKDDLANKDARDAQAQQAVASAQAQAAQAAATQAMFQNQGFPPAAARQAAQTFVAGPTPISDKNVINEQMQIPQDSWQNAPSAPGANTMQNMQSILFAVQNGIQQMTNGGYQTGFMPMHQQNTDSMNAQARQATNDVLS